jgi:GTPase SAR1 family protein
MGGQLGTGKARVIRRAGPQFFCHWKPPTAPPDFLEKDLVLDDHGLVAVQLWDIGDTNRLASMFRLYARETSGVFVAFDTTRVATLDRTIEWKKEIDSTVFTSENQPVQPPRSHAWTCE